MNFHIIFVHFPIALLTLYSILEIISWGKLSKNKDVFKIKAFLVIIGVASAYPSLWTGGLLEHAPGYERQVLNLHETFANSVSNLFLVLAIVYFLVILYRGTKLHSFISSRQSLSKPVQSFFIAILKLADGVVKSGILPFVALLGLLALTITGALGGILSKGPQVDPITDFVYKLFF